MEAREARKAMSAETLLRHMQQRHVEMRDTLGEDDVWPGQRVSDLAAELGWSQQRTRGAIQRLLAQGEIRATESERIYARFRRMTEVRYRTIEKLAPLPAWLMPQPYPVLHARRVSG